MSHDDDYIGYGRPPSWTKFQKGRSGNPKGRPRRAKPQTDAAPHPSAQDDILRRALAKPVEIREGGKNRQVPMKEVIQQKQIHLAAMGSIHAQREVLRAARELEERDRLRAEAKIEADERMFQYIVELRSKQASAWQAAAAEGREPDRPWPHPDDLIVDHVTKQWDIRGPFNEDGVDFFWMLRADRDVHIMRAILEIAREADNLMFARMNIIFFNSYDLLLPKRWQCGVDGWIEYAEFFVGLPLPLLEAILDSVERKAESFVRPRLSAEEAKDVYKTTNRIMRPLLKPMGYRSLREFEVAYAQMGDKLPWPKVQCIGGTVAQRST